MLYQAHEVTQGTLNAWPNISWSYPPVSATVDSETFTISWNGISRATSYQFQLDDLPDFTSPLTDTLLLQPTFMPTSVISEGTYYWRVKTLFPSGESQWTPSHAIDSLVLPTEAQISAPVAISRKVLGVAWQLQHKDTNMLCLDGDDEVGDFAWDAPHIDRGDHGNSYCVRASIAMMASYYGGTLSQDRISYEIFREEDSEPESDLGHDRGVAPPPDPIETDTLTWALGEVVPVQVGKPDFQDIKTWIDADQPIMARIPGHMRVIDGYSEFTILGVGWRFIHLLDPWDRAKWVSYASDDIRHYWVGPAGVGGAPNVLSDEDADGDGIADTMDDSDGDGVCDFDEEYRFQLDPQVVDTDEDLVADKLDIREYVFDNNGTYFKRDADIDGDHKRKELDPDNDNAWDVTAWDGYEDTNHNGRFEVALDETDNFTAGDDRVPQIDITAPSFGQHYGYNCSITVEGTIHSDTVITSTVLQVSGGQDYVLIPTGTMPNYAFRQTEVNLFDGGSLIMLIATNEYGPGRDYVEVYANCYVGYE